MIHLVKFMFTCTTYVLDYGIIRLSNLSQDGDKIDVLPLLTSVTHFHTPVHTENSKHLIRYHLQLKNTTPTIIKIVAHMKYEKYTGVSAELSVYSLPNQLT